MEADTTTEREKGDWVQMGIVGVREVVKVQRDTLMSLMGRDEFGKDFQVKKTFVTRQAW